MPNQNMDYSKSVIYQVCCKDDGVDKVWIGTTTGLKSRPRYYAYNANNRMSKRYNYPLFKFIREHGGWIRWGLCPLEAYPCNDKFELERRKNWWLEKKKDYVLNEEPMKHNSYIEDNIIINEHNKNIMNLIS